MARVPAAPMPAAPPTPDQSTPNWAPPRQTLLPGSVPSANQHAPPDFPAYGGGQWDAWGNVQGQNQRPLWRISRKFTEGLIKFDGDLSQYRAWKNRIRDHASEEWPSWRIVLDNAERVQDVLTPDYLNSVTICGVNAMALCE